MVTSSARPFLLLVLSTKSRASACAVAGSRGRSVTSLSSGSPGTMDQRSKTRDKETWPCVWIYMIISTFISKFDSLATYPQISLEPERVDDWNESPHVVKWRTSNWLVLQHVASPSGKHCVQIALGFRRTSHAAGVDGLHQPWVRHEETRVARSSTSRNDLTATTENSLRCQLDVGYTELCVTNRLLTQRSFTCRPAEALPYRISDCAQCFCVDL